MAHNQCWGQCNGMPSGHCDVGPNVAWRRPNVGPNVTGCTGAARNIGPNVGPMLGPMLGPIFGPTMAHIGYLNGRRCWAQCCLAQTQCWAQLLVSQRSLVKRAGRAVLVLQYWANIGLGQGNVGPMCAPRWFLHLEWHDSHSSSVPAAW